MSRTIRWYQIPEKVKKLTKARKVWIHPWKYINPFYFRHEHKLVRVEEHRKYRHRNKIRVEKGMDIFIEPKTNGWLTH
jgi:hypothetical protein